MATVVRHDRMIPLRLLSAYPGQAWLDMVLFLPKVDPKAVAGELAETRRLWLLAPEGSPTALRVNDRTLTPAGPPTGGWTDFGAAEIDTGFSILHVIGLSVAQARAAHLLVTKDLAFDPRGKKLADVERALWGLAREDAGFTALSPDAVQAGDAATFTLAYTAGPRGLPAEARVRLAVPKLFSRPQVQDPAAGGYVQIAAGSQVAAVDRVEDSLESHEKTDIVIRLKAALAAGEGFTLRYHTQTMYLFTNTLREVDRMYWYSNIAPLAAAVAIADDRPFVSLAEGNSHTFTTYAGPAEQLHLMLPGRRRVGEPLQLHGVFTDHLRNVPPSGPIDLDIQLQLEGPSGKQSLGSPSQRMQARYRFAIDLEDLPPGVYRAMACRVKDGQVIAQSNPLEVMDTADRRGCIYWGEIHTHTEMSDGSGTYESLYRHSREEGCQDFAAAADHACYHSDNQWQWMQDVTNAANEPGKFTTLIGYEWAGRQVHRNVYTSAGRLELFRGMYAPTSNLDAVYRHFRNRSDVVAGPHGLLAHGVIWKHHDPQVERFAEIYSMWGAGDQLDNPLACSWARENPNALTINQILATGAKLGFTGGGDCHEARGSFSCRYPQPGVHGHTFAPKLQFHSGITAAVAPSLDRAPLLEALRSRSTYASSGPRILLDFAVSGIKMGGEGRCRQAQIAATVHAVDEIAQVEVFKDGKLVHSQQGHGPDAGLTWTDPAAVDAEHYYYLRVVQTDGEMAWSSPVWIGPSS